MHQHRKLKHQSQLSIWNQLKMNVHQQICPTTYCMENLSSPTVPPTNLSHYVLYGKSVITNCNFIETSVVGGRVTSILISLDNCSDTPRGRASSFKWEVENACAGAATPSTDHEEWREPTQRRKTWCKSRSHDMKQYRNTQYCRKKRTILHSTSLSCLSS